MSFFNRLVGAIVRPTALIDEHIAETILPKITQQTDDGKTPSASEYLDQLTHATYYAFDDRNPPPQFVPAKVKESTQKHDDDDAEACDVLRGLKPAATATPLLSLLPQHMVHVANNDCLAHASALHVLSSGRYKRIGVLNMANERNVGGAFSCHWGSQEEYLFRNCTMGLSLWPHRSVGYDDFRCWEAGTKLLGPPSAEKAWYPFSKYACIVTPHVEVFALEDKKLPEENRFVVATLTIAAQDLRSKTVEKLKSNPNFDPELMCQKLRAMFHGAIASGCDALVLGALGAGAFRLPPLEVAQCFKKVIEEIIAAHLDEDGKLPPGKFPFRQIDFAIIKSEENLAAFQKVFGS